jgi:hypothetical protein
MGPIRRNLSRHWTISILSIGLSGAVSNNKFLGKNPPRYNPWEIFDCVFF